MKKISFLFFLLLSTFTYGQHYTYIVAQDGSGNYKTIQEAIDATKSYPPEEMSIFIKNGTYNEKVTVPNWNCRLKLIGESREKTVITYGDHFNKINRGRNSTFMTETFLVRGNDVTLQNMTIINSAGPVGQAIALGVEADRVVVENVSVIGNQDALYVAGENCRQYFRNCYIEGTTDFIFGEATAFFENCNIYSKSNSYITAASTPQNVPFGFVFVNCKLTSKEGLKDVSLGRPWRNYAKTVFIKCELGKQIKPEGWTAWSKTESPESTFYAEYENYGEGAKISARLPWSHQLTKDEAEKYTKENVLKARVSEINTNWIKK